MIVVSIDPVRKTVGMLSVPRDLWVDIPGYQPNRVNTANYLGDSSGYPGGGPALAARTITDNLGIKIDRYLRVNFDVFTQVVNLVAPNGVEVCPTEAIDDDHYPDAGYGTITVHFDPGCQRLEAERLLQYARTRATEGSDFDRAQRQQEVIKALRDAVLNAGGIVNFIGQIPALWDSLSGAYVTDLTLEEIIALGALASEIPRENIQSGVINNLYVDLASTASGEQVLVPRYDAIRSLMDDVFNPRVNVTLSELRERAAAENAEIVVYNNTDIPGLAGQTRDWLNGQGLSITSQPGNVPEPGNTPTVIRDYTGRLWTARYLAALLGLPADRIQPGNDGLTSADVMIVAGSDMPQILQNPPTG
jgi:LCP family protein required for cell wall assembly